MVSVCREMGILLMKTSYSTIFNEGLDFTCALSDAKGDMIACAEFCPTMIGGMPILIKTISRRKSTSPRYARATSCCTTIPIAAACTVLTYVF